MNFGCGVLRRAALCLDQATHREQDGKQISADPSCVLAIVSSIFHKSQEFFS